MPERLFVFMQIEFPWALGPADGRYLLRLCPDAEPERVVVLGTLQARRAPSGKLARAGSRGLRLGRLGSRAPVAASATDPAAVTSTRVTVIDPISLSAEHQARAWLEDLDRERDVLAAVDVINRVLHLHRIAAADPYVHEVSPAQALAIRAGWGEGEQVASGRWLHARELAWSPNGRRPGTRRGGARARSAVLRPQERLAALLGARASTLMCEELTLRARLDLDRGRVAHAAIELDGALASSIGELRAEDRQDLAIRIAELEQLRPGVAAQAQAALSGAGGQEQRRLPGAGGQAGATLADAGAGPDEETVAHALGRLEAALRARTAPGIRLE